MIISRASRRRHEHLRRELDLLKQRSEPTGSKSRFSAKHKYRQRLGQVLSSWKGEINRRVTFLDAPRVWEFVAEIRVTMGDEYGELAANIAFDALEPLLRKRKSINATTY